MLSIDRITSYLKIEEFYEKYLIPNKPCIFSSCFTEKWKSVESWQKDGNIKIKSVLSQLNDNLEIDVANCNKFYFDSHCKNKMMVKEFVEYWNNDAKGDKLYYLKDWHYFLNSENSAFQLLDYFRSDWLNEFWEIRRDIIDDYKFVYVGVKGSWTGLHADVLRSFSWSANVCGRKRWRIFPRGSEKYFPPNLVDLDQVSAADLPNHIDVVQELGEVIFIPSGWFHQVNNLTDCVSINHNWLNGVSLMKNWNFLCEQLTDVERETEDVAETPGYIEQCQVCLRAYSGMNIEEFLTMILCILLKRLTNSDNPFTIPMETRENISKLKRWCELELMKNRDLLLCYKNSTDIIVCTDVEEGISVLKSMLTKKVVRDLDLLPDEFIEFLNSI